jgi:GNAT superfamily N-acetyltransferase
VEATVDPDFLARHTTEVGLADGTRLRIRPIVPEDKPLLRDGLERLSPRSRFMRFLQPVDRLTEDQLAYLTELDYDDHFAWGAIALDEPGEPGVGVARYVRDPGDRTVAEAAVVVVDDYQGRGVGTVLLEVLAESALQHGIDRFRAYVATSNDTVVDALRMLGARIRGEDGDLVADLPLPLPAGTTRDTALYGALRAVARGEAQARPLRWWRFGEPRRG